ncbi:MAG: hypothetical protein AAFY73_10075 [Pseudomonadota bacterium]
MLTDKGEMLEHDKTKLKTAAKRQYLADDRFRALVRLLAKSAATRDHALQLKIERETDQQLQKGNN